MAALSSAVRSPDFSEEIEKSLRLQLKVASLEHNVKELVRQDLSPGKDSVHNAL